MVDAVDILKFWFEELTPEDHFKVNDDVDESIRTKYHDLWFRAAGGGLADWSQDAKSALALLILLDQFPRNMFRGSSQSFHSDALARELARKFVKEKFDMQHDERRRLFFYLPFMHSEDWFDQSECVRLISSRLPTIGKQNFIHARAHLLVITLFGRFPYRNAVLGRASTTREEDWLRDSGYQDAVRIVQESHKL